MKITIEEMKQVESAKAELEKLALQVSAKLATAKQSAINEACKEFKAYFAAKKFEITGSAWNLIATYGSIVFKLDVKNSPTGGAECMVLHFPEMVKLPPLAVYPEAKREQAAAEAAPAIVTSQSPLADIRLKIDKMLERLNAPAPQWFFYTLDAHGSGGQRKDYATFVRFLNEESP